MEEDLRKRLIDGLKGSVAAGSIAWGDRPQASALPGVTLDYIDDARPQHMEDFQALRPTQVQVDVWADDKLTARNLRETVIGLIVPAATVGSTFFRRSFVDRLASSFEDPGTGILYRERIDFTVWHSA